MKHSFSIYAMLIGVPSLALLTGCSPDASSTSSDKASMAYQIPALKENTPFDGSLFKNDILKEDGVDLQKVSMPITSKLADSEISLYCATSLIQRRSISTERGKQQFWVDSGVWQQDQVPAEEGLAKASWNKAYSKKKEDSNSYAAYLSNSTIDSKYQIIGASDTDSRIVFVHTGIPCKHSFKDSMSIARWAIQNKSGVYLDNSVLHWPKDTIIGALRYTQAMANLLDHARSQPQYSGMIVRPYEVTPLSIVYDSYQKQKIFGDAAVVSTETMNKSAVVSANLKAWQSALLPKVKQIDAEISNKAPEAISMGSTSASSSMPSITFDASAPVVVPSEDINALKLKIAQLEKAVIQSNASKAQASAPGVKIPVPVSAPNLPAAHKQITEEDILRNMSGN